MFRSLTDLRWLVGLIALHLYFFSAGSAVAKPNIIFILADDHRYDALSCLGHPFIKTRNIDRIAEDGVIFENFFVTSALCSPSRASFLTGAYPHNHEAVINDWCDPQLPMFPEMLKDLGYETGYIGKWHLARHNDPRPGFDHWFSFAGQGSYTKNTFNENGEKLVIERYVTDELNDRALDFIQQERDKPFALYLSHKAIHGPFTPAERHKDLYADAELLEPETWNDPMSDKPDEIRRIMSRGMQTVGEREAKLLWEAGKPVPRMEMKPVEKRLAPRKWDSTQEKKRDYYRAINAVDDGVGAIHELLEQKGILDNTIIIYAGDNGFGAGEHRRYGGKRTGYEESLRVPFIMRYPGVFPGNTRVDEICLNIDLAPTLVEAAGGVPPDSIDGVSFLRLAQGKSVEWRESFLYEYYREPWTQRYPTILGVRTKSWKYLTYPDSAIDAEVTDELYDLEIDSIESKNLSMIPSFTRQKQDMVDELSRLKRKFGYRSWSFAEVYDETPEPKFWYEDNNMRRAGGYPDDLQYMFENPDTWSEMRARLSVYFIRGNTLRNLIKVVGDKWISNHFCRLLREEEIPVAIDNPTDISSIKLLESNGVTVSHIALQSVLSKFQARPMLPEQRREEISKRIEATVPELARLRWAFPQTKIGIIDALPAKGIPYAGPYKSLLEKSRAAGAAVQFIHVDAPCSAIEKTIGWGNLYQLKKTISQDLELEFGMIVTDNVGGMDSNKSFYDQVMLIADKYPAAAFPDYFIMMSWYHHPKQAVRNVGPEGEYTMTRAALDFFNAISNRIPTGAPKRKRAMKAHGK